MREGKAQRSLRTGLALALSRLRRGSFQRRILLTITLSVAAAVAILSAASILELRRAVSASDGAHARALLDHLSSMPAFRGRSAEAQRWLRTVDAPLKAVGDNIELVPRTGLTASNYVWTRTLPMKDGAYVLGYRVDSTRSSRVNSHLIAVHVAVGLSILIVLLAVIGIIVQHSILAPLAAGERQLNHMKRGGGWLPALPSVDREIDPLYSAIRQLGPALACQVDAWLETDRRSHTALIFLNLNRRLREPLETATAAVSLLHNTASLPLSLCGPAAIVQQQLERIAAILTSEEERAIQSLGPRDEVRGHDDQQESAGAL